MLLKEEAVQAAFDWLAEKSDEAAAARANAMRKEYRVKIVEARLYMEAEGSTVKDREMWVKGHPAYEEACLEHADAEGILEAYRDRRNKCAAIIDAWRSQQRMERDLGRMK